MNSSSFSISSIGFEFTIDLQPIEFALCGSLDMGII